MTTPDAEIDPALAADLADARAENPDRTVEILDYVFRGGHREMIVFRPTEGQVAAMLRAAQSRQMSTEQTVADLLDILSALLVYPEDRQWLAVGMLDGTMDLGDEDDATEQPASALGLLRAVSMLFAVEGADNRAARRAAARRFR